MADTDTEYRESREPRESRESREPRESRGGGQATKPSTRLKVARLSSTGVVYVDYKRADDLRRMLTPNGKIQGRKRTQLNAREQRLVALAIRRARYMGLIAYTSATL
jgi:small subunit ribosomal protein S18